MKFTFSLLYIFISCSSFGQNESDNTFNEKGFSVYTVYDSHILTWAHCAYKPTIGYRINYLKAKEKSIINFGIGYDLFKPKADTLYYLIGSNAYGQVAYSNFTAIPAYFGITKSLSKNNIPLKLEYGIDLGILFYGYSFNAVERGRTFSPTTIEGLGNICPRAGIKYELNKSLSINWRTGIHLLFTFLGGDKEAINFATAQKQSITFFSLFSSGIGISYVFNKQ